MAAGGRFSIADCRPEQEGGLSAYLTSRIDDFGREILATRLNNVTEGVLYGGIVTLDEMPFDKSNRERRFSCIRRGIC